MLYVRRMEEQLREMQDAQKQMTQEMEGIRANSQKFRAALSSIEPQVVYAEDSKKRVSQSQCGLIWSLKFQHNYGTPK